MKLMANLFGALGLVAGLAQPTVAADEDRGVRQVAQAGEVHTAKGVVKAVDSATGKVNIAHEPIDSLGWPAMRMNFKAQDPASLEGIEPGQTVQFELRKSGNEYLITRISPVK